MYKVFKDGKVIHEEATYEQASSWLWMYKRALKAFDRYSDNCQLVIEKE